MSTRVKSLFVLHILLMVYSLSGVLSKLAADVDFFSFEFCTLYVGILFLLGLYALGWQQVLKRLPLTTAFSNKAVTIVWGIIWGFVFFAESVTIPEVIGALMIIGGVVLYSRADAEVSEKSDE